MYKLFIIIFLSLVSCSSNNSNLDLIKSQKEKITLKSPFGIHFQLEEKESKEFSLMTTIELEEGDFIISPFSTDGFYGKVDFSFEESDNISLDSSFSENPISKEEMDAILHVPVRFVRETVNYFHTFHVNNESNFNVNGKIWLVLEPSCVPYEVDFMISQREGKVTAQKIAIRNVLPKK